MPLLAHSVDNTALDGSPTGTTDWDTHLVVAGQTIELSLQLPGFDCQFLPVYTQILKHIKGHCYVVIYSGECTVLCA